MKISVADTKKGHKKTTEKKSVYFLQRQKHTTNNLLFWFLFFLTRKTSAEKNWMETDKSEFLKKQNEQMLQQSKFGSNQDMFEFVLGKESPHWRWQETMTVHHLWNVFFWLNFVPF